MEKLDEYFDSVIKTLNAIKTDERETMETAADLIYESLSAGGFLYTFGTGHGHMLAEELFYRAGGLVRVKAILETDLMLHISASKSTSYERDASLALNIFEKYNPQKGDVLIIASNSGRNELPVEFAVLAAERGIKTICITNLNHSKGTTARHKSGKKLFQVCDLVIDNHGVKGDACIKVGQTNVSPTSTVTGAAILQAIIAQTVSISQKNNNELEVYTSSNVEGGDEKNEIYLQKYCGKIISL